MSFQPTSNFHRIYKTLPANNIYFQIPKHSNAPRPHMQYVYYYSHLRFIQIRIHKIVTLCGENAHVCTVHSPFVVPRVVESVKVAHRKRTQHTISECVSIYSTYVNGVWLWISLTAFYNEHTIYIENASAPVLYICTPCSCGLFVIVMPCGQIPVSSTTASAAAAAAVVATLGPPTRMRHEL